MLGVIIVTYASGDVIEACLDSLVASEGADISIAICDNASPDDTVEKVRGWARNRNLALHETTETGDPRPEGRVTLIRSSVNRGFAGGVNLGIRFLMRDRNCNLFWILNPDCEVAPDAAAAFEACALKAGEFALMGSRIVYREAPGLIQSDGGHVERWTGVCHNVNQGADPVATALPSVDQLDYLSGASVVASRHFIETVGAVPENYFLYYEEVEWAARRGALPLVLCAEAVVHHHGGTAIGTGAVDRLASPFALYFNYRNRMRFVRAIHPVALPLAYLASLARVGKLVAKGAWSEAASAFLGLNQLPPPQKVREKLAPNAAALAFGRVKVGSEQRA
jgi:GT2 family glycosyltransferase